MPIIRSLSTAVAASGLPSERGGSSVVGPVVNKMRVLILSTAFVRNVSHSAKK